MTILSANPFIKGTERFRSAWCIFGYPYQWRVMSNWRALVTKVFNANLRDNNTEKNIGVRIGVHFNRQLPLIDSNLSKCPKLHIERWELVRKDRVFKQSLQCHTSWELSHSNYGLELLYRSLGAQRITTSLIIHHLPICQNSWLGWWRLPVSQEQQ